MLNSGYVPGLRKGTVRASAAPLLASLLLALTTLGGCGGSAPPPVTTPPPAPVIPTNPSVVAKNIYINDLTNSTVDVYAANLNGKASPSSVYAVRGSAMTGDAMGTLYVAAITAPDATVQVFPSGTKQASRTLTVKNTVTPSSNQVSTMLADAAGDLYVAFPNVIYFFPAGASGMVAPTRTLTNIALTAPGVTQMALDSLGNLYVAESAYGSAEVVKFGPTATGTTAPTTVTAPVYFPTGIAFDASDNMYISQGTSECSGCGTYSAAINVFAPGFSVGDSPKRTIAGTKAGFAISSGNLFVDAAGNIFIQLVQDGQQNFEVFSATANGNVAPSSVLVRAVGATTDFQSYVR